MSETQRKLKGLEADWDICNKEDDRKKNLIKNLFAFIKEQEYKIEEIESDLLANKTANKAYHKEKNEVKVQIEALQRERERHLFAAVLIDGDCMPFKDGLVQGGLDGGRKAASLLKQAVEEALKSNAAHHVVIRVYSNVKGLAKTYKGADVLSESSTSFDEFIRGFNMSDPMCDYIDSGNGKECADVKIKANFEHYLNDVHCVQIFFGGTADNGYARLLGLHVEDETRCGRITLIEGGIPFARELEEIKDKFRAVNFEHIFRASKLEAAPKRNYPIRNSSPPASASASPSPSTSVNYASVAETAQRAPVPPAGSTRAAAGSPKSTNGSMAPTVLKNARGQRVDPPLKYDKQDYIDLRGRKMCNNFHLLGNCPYGDNCFHEHGKTLSAKQKQALRVFARQSPCKTVLSGLSCDDPDCYSGHQCPYGDRCDFNSCRFTDEMHLEDTTPVKTTTIR